MSSCLRCLTCIELYLHASYYAAHPVIKECHRKRAFLNESTALFAALSFFATDSCSEGNNISAIEIEAMETAKNCRYSSFACILALSSVIQQPIESYFPIKNPSNLDSYERLCNCTIIPREYNIPSTNKVHIFHAAAAPVDFLFSSKVPEEKNHYVPLLPIEAIENSQKTNKNIHHSLKHKQTKISFPPKKSIACNINVEGNCSTQELSQTGDFHASSHSSEDSNHSCDVGHFYKLSAASFSDERMYNLLCGTWRPEHSSPFHVIHLGRRFQLNWLEKFTWLVYSRSLDGAFCLNCVLFGGESSHNASKLQYLYSLPLTYWKTALQKFSEHEQKSPKHLTATLKASNFVSWIRNKTRSISVQFDATVMSQVNFNREKLKPIVEAIILCGKQNISLRGHRDEATYCDEDDSTQETYKQY